MPTFNFRPLKSLKSYGFMSQYPIPEKSQGIKGKNFDTIEIAKCIKYAIDGRFLNIRRSRLKETHFFASHHRMVHNHNRN